MSTKKQSAFESQLWRASVGKQKHFSFQMLSSASSCAYPKASATILTRMSSRNKFRTPRTAGEGPQAKSKTSPWPPGDKALTFLCLAISNPIICDKQRPIVFTDYKKNLRGKRMKRVLPKMATAPSNCGSQHVIPLRSGLFFIVSCISIADRNLQLMSST